MASSGIIVFIFPVLCICAVKSGFIKVECKAENVGHYGQQSLLECVVKTSSDVTDPNIRMVAWKKLTSPEDEGDLLLGFNRGKLDRPKRGYRFAEPSWNEKNMNVSLLITNTAVADDGDYKCIVITDSGDHNIVTTLKVQARYRIPSVHSTPEKIVPNSESTLICESRGGYPKGTLRWFDEEGTDWTGSSEMETKPSDDGLFQLTSRLSLFRGSTFPIYTCAVFNASGGKEDSITFETNIHDKIKDSDPTKPSPETSKIVAPLVVIGSLIVGLLLLLLYRRRSQRGRGAVPAAEQDLEEGYNSHEDEPINQDQS
ncbi:CD276 antigen isoform X2 [Haplochromis burtoni]|uniref:CD276 antigen isoform X2 n=1 Tax=Haplochromis burtoni TaxID=8153 RepID=UPI0003BCABEF|nr:CD276 antigen isoform X2 [Haplochromis burtoni]